MVCASHLDLSLRDLAHPALSLVVLGRRVVGLHACVASSLHLDGNRGHARRICLRLGRGASWRDRGSGWHGDMVVGDGVLPRALRRSTDQLRDNQSLGLGCNDSLSPAANQ